MLRYSISLLSRIYVILTALALMVILSLTQVHAQNLMTLDVSSENAQTDIVHLSIEALDALPQTAFETSTIWTDEDISFSGVALKTLLEHLDMKGEAIEMIALNEYAVSMPMTDLEDEAPIIATRINGQTMSVRGKGPFWIVFPYDSDPKYQTETIYARSIWQLNRLNVVD